MVDQWRQGIKRGATALLTLLVRERTLSEPPIQRSRSVCAGEETRLELVCRMWTELESGCGLHV